MSEINKAAEEGVLPALPEPMANFDGDKMVYVFGEPEFQTPFYTSCQMVKYGQASVAAYRASRHVANKANATPTGASTAFMPTVLTNERIIELMDPELYKGDGGYLVDMFPKRVIAAGRAIEREIAAQADQVASVPSAVAVPEGWKLVPDKPTESMIDAFYGQLASVACSYFDWEDGGDEGYAAMIAAAPSPAKESK